MSVKTYVVDLRVEHKRRNTTMISDFLVEHLRSTLAQGQQAILLLNKRGYASSLLCTSCGTAVFCPSCDISMTYHKGTQGAFLLCHYCGVRGQVPHGCGTCGQQSLKSIGTGTQQVEEQLQRLLPTARIRRVDVDTMRKKSAYDQLYQDMHAHQIDILVGTQILAKGFDFPGVTLVGILNADVSLHVPDFRSSERMFQLITQVMGRASRQGQEGVIVVQTFNPDLPVLQYALHGDIDGFHEYELSQRQQFGYPPFGEIVKLTLVHPRDDVAKQEATRLQAVLAAQTPPNVQVLMAPAYVTKQHNKYHYHILLKGPDVTSLLETLDIPSSWRIDVDPLHTT